MAVQWLGGHESDLPHLPPVLGLTSTAAPAGPPGPPPPASSTQGDIPNAADPQSLGRKKAMEWNLGQNKEIHPEDLTKTKQMRWRWVGECHVCGISAVSEWGFGEVARIPGWSTKQSTCPACMGHHVPKQHPHPEASQPPPPPHPPPGLPPPPPRHPPPDVSNLAGLPSSWPQLPSPPGPPPGDPPPGHVCPPGPPGVPDPAGPSELPEEATPAGTSHSTWRSTRRSKR